MGVNATFIYQIVVEAFCLSSQFFNGCLSIGNESYKNGLQLVYDMAVIITGVLITGRMVCLQAMGWWVKVSFGP